MNMKTKVLTATTLALLLGASVPAMAQSGGEARGNDRKIEKALDNRELTPIRPIRRVGEDGWPAAKTSPAPGSTASNPPPKQEPLKQDAQQVAPKQEPAKQEPAKQETAKQNTAPQPHEQAQQPTQPAQQPKEAAQNNQDNKDNSGDKQDKGFASIRLGTDANGRVAINDAQERQISSVLRKQRIQTFDVAVTIGAVAPASVRLGAVSADIVEVLPQFRGYSFFATRENVVIVEPDSKKIVALVPVQLTATASRPQQERSATRSDTTRKSSETHREPAIETRREASTTIERDVTVGSGIPTREEILAAPVVGGNTAVTRTYRAVPNETIIIERRRRPPAWLFGFER